MTLMEVVVRLNSNVFPRPLMLDFNKFLRSSNCFAACLSMRSLLACIPTGCRAPNTIFLFWSSRDSGTHALMCGDDLVTVVKSEISNFEVCL